MRKNMREGNERKCKIRTRRRRRRKEEDCKRECKRMNKIMRIP